MELWQVRNQALEALSEDLIPEKKYWKDVSLSLMYASNVSIRRDKRR